MKLNLAIAGYGNLGKSLEKAVLEDEDCRLIAVFSRRNLDSKHFVPMKNIEAYAPKIDVLLLALGSHNDLQQNLEHFRNFHTVDSFDIHNEMSRYKAALSTVKPNKISLCGMGWDPGILSCGRALFDTADGATATFWGKGISQGHSYALRSIPGVLDAVEITVPQSQAEESFLAGNDAEENSRHLRLCYVACVEADKPRIAKEITDMPHYFLGQQTRVEFCTPAQVREIKKDTKHCGRVLARGKGFLGEMRLETDCNTQLTAAVMLKYAKAVPQLVKDGFIGALDPLDIPLKYVANVNLV